MARKVLILGSTGLIGHQLYYYCERHTNYHLFNVSFRRKLNQKTLLMDARKFCDTQSIIQEIRPDVIVNCIGVLISESNRDPETAILVNAYFPHKLRSIADEVGAKLVQISTDCVYSGLAGSYTETSPKDGHDIYGKTKALGEINVDPHVTIRSSVIGPELKPNGEELFHWFMSQSGSINGYMGAIWSGVTTIQLSRAIVWAIENSITQTYHVTNGKSISKYELLKLLRKEVGMDIEIVPIEGRKVNRSFLDTRMMMNYSIPDYPEMIREMVNHVRANTALYAQYNLS